MIFFTITETEQVTNNSISLLEQIIVSALSGILGSVLTLIGAIFVFYKGREDAKKEFLFNLYLKELFPLVYRPILTEYYNFTNASHDGSIYNIDTNLIENTISDNYTLIKFAPKKLRTIIFTLYSQCKAVNSIQKYDQKQKDILQCLENIKAEIDDNFKEYLNGE
ncbi:hypothetical protein [Salinibacillus xinjiangensis]|uniref:Uncharacterized protein n=1 Tax=Salinibacillus xinjiangensis TaxID=1229268 RepID=A0A6G1X818_9BACI|nr:hypothetical protein [Salinibacillus xinjiangensis]MRG87020.1 hypothetical protein [Salinibacillus xinjiangensis]